MVSYREIGLVNSKELFKKALKGNYAIPGYNFNNMEQLQAIIKACVVTESPVILQVSKGAREYANQTLLRYMAEGAVAYAKELHPEGKQIPIVLHLDHGGSFDICKSCIDTGFSSVMYDGSHLPYEENIKISQRVVEYAHSQEDYISVECELGVLAGVEDDVSAEKSTYTNPEEVIDFSTRTECDSLAISIGTSHGANKFTSKQCTRNDEGILIPPPLKFNILEEIQKKLPGFPIVLHGSSSVPPDLVEMINKHGGTLKDAIGIPEGQLKRAAQMNVCKINIDSDGRLAVTAMIRKMFAEKPAEFDPRKYLGPAREALAQLYVRKNREVLDSAGHAFD
ncbi:MAG: class II fructose-bisphosphate aldolase [Promethearchaeota archaeon]